MAFIPGGQGFAKLSKIGSSLVKAVDRGSDVARGVDKVADTIKLGSRGALRQNMIKATGKPAAGMQAHHALPWEFRDFFTSKSISININDAKYGVWLKQGEHSAVTYGKNVGMKYNDLWYDKISSGTLNSARDVEQFAKDLAGQFGYKLRF